MNTLSLLREIALLRPMATNLIQTILEPGNAGASLNTGIVDETGRSTPSLRTIVTAMGVLDDFSKTKDFGGTASSKAVHAYYLVQRAVDEQRANRGVLFKGESSEPADVDRFAGDVRSRPDSD